MKKRTRSLFIAVVTGLIATGFTMTQAAPAFAHHKKAAKKAFKGEDKQEMKEDNAKDESKEKAEGTDQQQEQKTEGDQGAKTE